MDEIESEGKTVAEAVENALKQSGLRRDQVEVETIREASSGFMGLGARTARVRIREKRWATDGSTPPAPPQQAQAPRNSQVSPRSAGRSFKPRRAQPAQGAAPQRAPQRDTAPDQPPAPRQRAEHRSEPRGERRGPSAPPRHRGENRAPREERAPRVEYPAPTPEECRTWGEQATEILREALKLMLFADAKVEAQWDPVQERVKAKVETSESDRLIGQDGRTLESLQYLVTLMITRRNNRPIAVWVDTQGYWENVEKSVLRQAEEGIETVRKTSKSVRLQPMDAAMRRLVHRTLAGHAEVTTASEGEGEWRKIVLRPKAQ